MATILEPASSASTISNIQDRAQQSKFWRSCAPPEIGGAQQWKIWTSHLTKQRSARTINNLLNSRISPLRWGLPDDELQGPLAEVITCLEKIATNSKGVSSSALSAAADIVSSWHRDASENPATVGSAVECLAIAHLLPWAASALGESDWWLALDELLGIAKAAEEWPIDCELPPEQSLVQQLLAGELPMTLAHLFPEIKCCHKLREQSGTTVSENIAELTNGQGMVRGPYLDWYAILLASWTRCHSLSQQSKKSSFKKKAKEQLQWAATQALRLSSQNGEPILSTPHSGSLTPDFLAGVLQFAGDRSDVSAAEDTLSKKLTKSIIQKPDNRFPETSDNCEWAGVASMRTEWEKGVPAVTIDYSSPDLRIGVTSGSHQLFSGTWDWETSVDGHLLEPVGSWEEICWFSDEDVDFLELTMELADGGQLDRQVLLARDENFLMLSDYVLTNREGEISHRMQIPLNRDVSFIAERETREGRLAKTSKPLGRILPLALAEWRTDPRFGELAEVDGSMRLAQQRVGRNLACPLLIDLDAGRSKKQCTWRQLTIAQNLEIQPHDVASGFRAQCGKDQWLFYRSLTDTANRSLLGQNLSCECVVARFLAASGEIEELVEIEG